MELTEKIFNFVLVFGVLCGGVSFVARKVSKINLCIFAGTFALVSLVGFVVLISQLNIGQTLIEIGRMLE